MAKLIDATCDNCGRIFRVTFEELDHTGFFTVIKSKRDRGETQRIYNFCCYDCEKAFVKRLEKKHPEMNGSWKEADETDRRKFPRYYEERTCALCEARAELKQSHIIPRFVAKWLKNTSATGFLRTAGNPDYRVQDTFKINLLCRECENRFSSLEMYFAENIFHPFHEGVREFSYDERLTKFVVSINWRLLRIQLYRLADDQKRMMHVKKALKTWQEYLLDRKPEPDSYENHVLFLDSLESSCGDLPPGFLWYAHRAIDGTIVTFDSDHILTYAKFPGILVASCVNPSGLEGWKGTKIDKKGKIVPSQEVSHPGFLEFLIARSRMATEFRISEIEDAKIAASIRSKPERFLRSKTLEVLLATGKVRREKLRQQLNPFVRQLVDIVDSSLIDPSLPEDSKNLARLGIHLIANTLTELTKEKAEELEKDMTETLIRSRETQSDSSSTTDLEELVVIFHTCLNSTNEKKYKKIEAEFTKAEENNLYPQTRTILVVAWNPLDKKPTFNWSYQTR